MKQKMQQWFICRYSLVSTGTQWNLRHYEYLCLSNSVLISRKQSPEIANLGSHTGPHPGDGQNRIWSFWSRSNSNEILLQKALMVSWGEEVDASKPTSSKGPFTLSDEVCRPRVEATLWVSCREASKSLRNSFFKLLKKPMINQFQGPENLPHFPSGSRLKTSGLGTGGCDNPEQNTWKPFLHCKSSQDCLRSGGAPVTQERERGKASQHLTD